MPKSLSPTAAFTGRHESSTNPTLTKRDIFISVSRLLNPPHGIAADDGEKIGEAFDPRQGIDNFFCRGRALELDHEAVFLEAAGDGARENLGQVELAAR